jgi:hypothetical protein
LPSRPSSFALFFDVGHQNDFTQGFMFYAWALHPGDFGVAPVSLPASVWLMWSGLVGMFVVARERMTLSGVASQV